MLYQIYQGKILALVLTSSVSVTASLKADPNDETLMVLENVPCIWYPIQFLGQKNQTCKIKILPNSGIAVNAITPAYIVKIGLTN